MRPDDGPGEIQRFEMGVHVDQRPSEFAVFDRRLGEHDTVRYCGVLDDCVLEYLDVFAQIGVREVDVWVTLFVPV